MYKILGQLETSDYFGCPSDQIKVLINSNEAKKYFTFLAMQNEYNKSLLEGVSEKNS